VLRLIVVAKQSPTIGLEFGQPAVEAIPHKLSLDLFVWRFWKELPAIFSIFRLDISVDFVLPEVG
jgi:hypothetical protein